MENNFEKLKKEAQSFIPPQECAENDRAVKMLAKETKEGHYNSINLLVMSVVLIFTAVAFLAVNGEDSSDNNTMSFSWKAFLSGTYAQELESSYNNNLPVPDVLKAAEERISLIYGIGNKLSDPVREIDDTTNANQNSFDEPQEEDGSANENVITTTAVQTDKDGNEVTTTDTDEEKSGGGTTALARPKDTTTTTTTTAAETTTTNNDAPDVTVTTTVPVAEVTTTTAATTTTASEATTESTTTTTTTSQTTPAEEIPPETTVSTEATESNE